MKTVVVALAACAPLLAGCASLNPDCPGEYPLVLRHYPSVTNASLYEFQTTLWNCTGANIPLDEPCEGRHGLLPRLTIGNATYHVAPGNRSALPRGALTCETPEPPRVEALPGDFIEQRYWWDGTYVPEGVGAPLRAPPGTYRVEVEAGLLRRDGEVRVPW